MVVLFKYIFLLLTAFCIFIYTIGCGNDSTSTPGGANEKNGQNTQNQQNTLDILYIIRDRKQKKRILYVDKNKKTPLLTLMTPDEFCLRIKKSDFESIQKIGLSSDLQEINQLLCSNEQKLESSNSAPNCDLRSYRITHDYKLEPLNLKDPKTSSLIKKNYEASCIEFVPW